MKQLVREGGKPAEVLAIESANSSPQAFGIESRLNPKTIANTVSRGFLLTAAIFIVLNASDFFLTAKLLSLGSFQEYNPLALFFIVQWGTIGMLAYKTLMATIAIACCHTIFQQRKRLGLGVLWGGNLILASVVTYSVLLLTNVITEDTAPFYVYVGP